MCCVDCCSVCTNLHVHVVYAVLTVSYIYEWKSVFQYVYLSAIHCEYAKPRLKEVNSHLLTILLWRNARLGVSRALYPSTSAMRRATHRYVMENVFWMLYSRQFFHRNVVLANAMELVPNRYIHMYVYVDVRCLCTTSK